MQADQRITALEQAEAAYARTQEQIELMHNKPVDPHEREHLWTQNQEQVSLVRRIRAAFTMHELLTISLSSVGSPTHARFHNIATSRIHDIEHLYIRPLVHLFHDQDYNQLATYDYQTILQNLVAYHEFMAVHHSPDLPSVTRLIEQYQQIQAAVLSHFSYLHNNARAFMSATHRPNTPPVAILPPDLLQNIAQRTLLPLPDPNKLPWL